MKKIYSVCHIGAGRIGFTLEFDKRRAKPATHIGMWEKNKNVKLSAVCEKNEIKKSKLNKISKSAKIYKNYIKAIQTEKPDIVWFMTDPRFWGWLWEMENEIRPLCPMVYYHVWDNHPAPHFNRSYYVSNDYIATISKVTDEIVKQVAPEVNREYIPHAVNPDFFRALPVSERDKLREQGLEPPDRDKVVFFWNNRNARRKQSGTLIFWFKEFLDIVGHDKAVLCMHTEPKDPNGQDLIAITDKLGLTGGQVKISTNKVTPEDLALIYNCADCTVNISDAEGFGLSTLESLSCETPIIVNMTGGLQEQVTDGEKWFGFGIEPSSKAIIGSQDVPYIYEDRLNKEDFLKSMLEFYNLKQEERDEMGKNGRQHVIDNYGFDKYKKSWHETMNYLCEKHGSWETRKNYKSWDLVKLK